MNKYRCSIPTLLKARFTDGVVTQVSVSHLLPPDVVAAFRSVATLFIVVGITLSFLLVVDHLMFWTET